FDVLFLARHLGSASFDPVNLTCEAFELKPSLFVRSRLGRHELNGNAIGIYALGTQQHDIDIGRRATVFPKDLSFNRPDVETIRKMELQSFDRLAESNLDDFSMGAVKRARIVEPRAFLVVAVRHLQPQDILSRRNPRGFKPAFPNPMREYLFL